MPCAQPAGLYRPRSPRTTPLYRLVESHYDEVKGQWEERLLVAFGAGDPCDRAGGRRPLRPPTSARARPLAARSRGFEGRCGFWRGFVDEQVRRYLDCGLFDNGFARVRCPDCRAEYLLAFSCKTRELCPSCAAKRAAVTAALLRDEVLEEVGHAQWVFTDLAVSDTAPPTPAPPCS